MNKDELLLTVKEAGEKAVNETLDEMTAEIIGVLKTSILDKLTDKKEELIAKLTEEISNTSGWKIKTRDYLYLLIVKIVDKFYQYLSIKLA